MTRIASCLASFSIRLLKISTLVVFIGLSAEIIRRPAFFLQNMPYPTSEMTFHYILGFPT